jgi:hypothetical protein
MEEKNIEAIYCFVDTNLLVHFQTFNEVEWTKILQAPQVGLVVAPIVLRELDKLKNDASNEWRQQRARMLVRKLRESLKPPYEVRQGVLLLMPAEEPSIEEANGYWLKLGLDANIADDRLIASIIEFRKKFPSAKILLLSDDIGVQVKAQSHGIDFREPDGLINRIERPSEDKTRIRKLEQQLEAVTNRMPKLICGFELNDTISNTFSYPTSPLWKWEAPDVAIAQEIEQKRKRLDQIISDAKNWYQISETETPKYSDTYKTYLTKYEIALKKRWLYDFIPYCELVIAVQNCGTAPATDVKPTFFFPEGSSIIKIGNQSVRNWNTSLPDEPIPEWTKLAQSMERALAKRPQITSEFNILPYFPPGLDELITEEFAKISHHMTHFITRLLVYLPCNTQQGFTIDYRIYADELIEPVEGILKVTWTLGE